MDDMQYKLDGRIWITLGDEKLLGHGRVELLERIQKTGSIRQAALQMKMSYKQAWDLIKHMNAKFKSPVVTSQRGGKGGGSALVTQSGQDLINQFHQLHLKFQQFLKDNSAIIQ